MAVGTSAAKTFIRPDGREKVTGAGRYTADLESTGMAHAAFRYADHPHARILRIDTTKARALAGVVAVITQDDLPDVRFGGLVQDRTLFAKDVVRFEGEIVAGVAALPEAAAAEAARLIEVEYEPLPALTDFVAAMDPDAPLVHADWASYERDEQMVADGNTISYATIVKGDADAAMAEADVVVKSRYESDASQGVPIEPRAVLAEWQATRSRSGPRRRSRTPHAPGSRRPCRSRRRTSGWSSLCWAVGSGPSATCTSRPRWPRSRARRDVRSGWSSPARRSSGRSRSAVRGS